MAPLAAGITLAVPIGPRPVFLGEPPGRRRRNVGNEFEVLILDLCLTVNMNDVGWSSPLAQSAVPRLFCHDSSRGFFAFPRPFRVFLTNSIHFAALPRSVLMLKA
jgi:hypothetical protein